MALKGYRVRLSPFSFVLCGDPAEVFFFPAKVFVPFAMSGLVSLRGSLGSMLIAPKGVGWVILACSGPVYWCFLGPPSLSSSILSFKLPY